MLITNKISNNLNLALRFSGSPIESTETVGQHVASMEFLAVELYNQILFAFPEFNLDIGKIFYKIAIHDLDEAAMGDIPRPVKYHDDRIYQEFERVAHEELSKNYHQKIVDDVKNAKSNDLPGVIVNFLDSVQCLQRLEISCGYNDKFSKKLHNSIEVLREKIAIVIKNASSFKSEEVEVLNFICDIMYEEMAHAESFIAEGCPGVD